MPKRQEGFARPVAQEKDRNVRAWLVFLCLVCFAVAFWKPVRRVFWNVRNRTAERAAMGVERVSDKFVAISFEGVSKTPDPSGRFVSLERFTEYIEALRSAGYNPISLRDVRDFYVLRRRLPRKAVLLTFENNHKSTFFDASPLLRKNHWRATMGVVTKTVRDWDKDSLLRPYLKTMALDATWDLACESDEGLSFVETGPFGSTAPFFAAPKWIGESNRCENVAEFRTRIEADHDRAMNEFTNGLAVVPDAFFFPAGNYGQYGSAGIAFRKANIEAVAARYPLAFLLGKQALNDAMTDPHRLNRLQVPPEWTAARLLRVLDLSWPVLADGSAAADPSIAPERWIADWGALESLGSHVQLSAVPSSDPRLDKDDATGGARAWIAGSNGFTEGMFDMRFFLERGEVHIYLRHAADDDYLRLAVSDGGRVSIGRCIPGNSPEILAEGGVDGVADFRSVHRIVVALRNNMLWTIVDGKMQFGGPVALGRVKTHGGLAGVGVWDSASGLACVRILEANLRTRLDGVATWPAVLSKDTARLARELRENAWRFAVVSPPWLDVFGNASVATDLPDDRSLHILARTNRASIQPRVTLHGADSFAAVSPGRIIELLREHGADGVFIDAADFPAEQIVDLSGYLLSLHEALFPAGFALSVRLPESLDNDFSASRVMTALPGTRLVNDTGIPPHGLPASRMAAILRLSPPGPEELPESVAQISGVDGDASQTEDPDSPSGFMHLRALGIKAYSDGDYGTAVEYWSKWADGDESSAEAFAFLGNAWNRMRDTTKAIAAYTRSLELEPGQIDLALELSRLYESSGRDDECASLLDAYARAFPDNRRVSVAQALWLDRHGSRLAGRSILRRLVDEDPADIQSRLVLQGLLDSPSERYGNMHELLAQVSSGGEAQRLGFGRDIAEAELLTIPESTVFFDFIRNSATNSVRPVVRALYDSFLPFDSPVEENFAESRLSDRWISFGTPLAEIAGTYDLKASSNMSEAYLRLKKSELLRDGFIEVVIGESVGAFWLYARRSSRNMVRFGFDGDGFLRIQSWSDGEPRTVDSRPWVRPAGDLTVRLEVRGDGAIGIVNGKRVFSNPLPIPHDIAYGWWSVAPFSPELGIARARILRISAGPLPPCVALMRETESEQAAAALDRLRDYTSSLSAVAPVLFYQHPDGTILEEPATDLMPFRMFCSYHRLRLMPTVALDFHSDVRPQTLVDIIVKHRFAGLVLQVRTMPTPGWFRETTALLEKTDADLLVVQSEVPVWTLEAPRGEDEESDRIAAMPPLVLRELERGSLLLPPIRSEWKVKPIPLRDWTPGTEISDPAAPVVIVLPPAAPASEAAPSSEAAAASEAAPAPEAAAKAPKFPEPQEAPELRESTTSATVSAN